MKRKRGKKIKSKKLLLVDPQEAVPDVTNLSTEDNSGPADTDKDEINSEMEIETTVKIDHLKKVMSVTSGKPSDDTGGKLVYKRVKVKIKTSKTLESQVASSDVPAQRDIEKSSQNVDLEKPGEVDDKMEDSDSSLPENNLGLSGSQPKKPGSIKLKSSKGFSSLGLSPCNNVGLMPEDKAHQNEAELPQRDSKYSQLELDTSLEVIKKIMRMDAVEPFNVPVNPVALGIPDYFDVVETPMDFGTICSNLENGLKYKNSEDVYKDVQYIWENCYKYNNKGDYILELMKRVKKNFSKYWSASGLYRERSHGSNGAVGIHSKDATPLSHGKTTAKGGYSKNKSQKRHKFKKHKEDCLCAICIMMRRRRERERQEKGYIADKQIENSNGILIREVKQEETSPGGSPRDGDTSTSNDHSLDQETDMDFEDKVEEDVKHEDTKQVDGNLQDKVEEGNKNETEIRRKGEGKTSEQSPPGSREHDKQKETQVVELDGDMQIDVKQKEISALHENQAAVAQQKPKELLDKNERTRIYESLHRRYENPTLLKLCGTLFSQSPKSLWSGPHSLVHNKRSTPNSSIHAAIASLMK